MEDLKDREHFYERLFDARTSIHSASCDILILLFNKIEAAKEEWVNPENYWSDWMIVLHTILAL